VFRFFLGGASEDAFGRRPVSYLQLQRSGGMDLVCPFHSAALAQASTSTGLFFAGLLYFK